MLTEQEMALQEFENRQQKQYRRGKVMVILIALLHIVLSAVNTTLDVGAFHPLLLIFPIAFSIALFRGVSWVRYVWGVLAGLGVLSALKSMAVLLDPTMFYPTVPAPYASEYTIFLIVVVLAYGIYCVFSCVSLLFSKSVSAFLYAQKNG